MKKLLDNYGIFWVLIGLCAFFSILTLKKQTPTGSAAVSEVYDTIQSDLAKDAGIVVVGAQNQGSADFATNLTSQLIEAGYTQVDSVVGLPTDFRELVEAQKSSGGRIEVVATTGDLLKWTIVSSLGDYCPEYADARIITPESYWWPDFLKRSNLLAIVDRIVVIAVIAIGMTMVIITGGIDLSVGSLIALSAVVATVIMQGLGGLEAAAWTIPFGFLIGILCCGFVGGFGGYLVHRFKVAPFITTLGVMMMARGLAFMITGGFSVYQVPEGLTWLGRGTMLGIPNTVILLLVLYITAHNFMSKTRYGRYIYAVGGNEESARLSGVPIRLILILVYVASGMAAGLGGCIQASQLNTGTPNLGIMYELYVIAAVVVGGTSLSGGKGRIFGTLIGAFIISVLQNGMNLLGVESYTQQVVLGGVILAAVLIDKLRGSETKVAQKQFKQRVPVWGWATIVVTLFIGALFVSAQNRGSSEKGKIGMTCMDLTNPFFKLIADKMEAAAAEHGYDFVALSGELDPAKQNNQLADFAAQGFDAIFINPTDSMAVSEGVKSAWDVGIPVFTFDVQVTEPEANSKLISHIGSDNYQGGLLAGESMMKATGDRGDVAILSFPEASSCIYRVQGFRDYLKEHNSRLRIVTELNAKGNRSDGYSVATDVLQAHPDIVGLFAINDPSALGAYAAIEKANKLEQITVVGFDGSPAGKQAVFEKKLLDTPQQFPGRMATGTVDAFMKYLAGEVLPKDIFIPCEHYLYEHSVNDESRINEQW
ncbi:MAG: substrate-binding domain-containing protein [Opitutales bacterium]|nr:substrate-binding domain-containing protein [Opitutales bacterium]